ncbi:MAG: M17 family metallopeptidase [Sandaracinaceae bacterium]
MLASLVTRKNASTLPLLPMDEAAFQAWSRRQSKARRAWLDRSEFAPRGNRVLLVPGPKGPSLALLGTSEKGPWPYAGAAQRLPPGRYRLDGTRSEEDATDAATGWALAHYRFDRYQTGAAKKPRELIWPKGADRAEVRRRVESTGWVRDLINTPAEDLGPAELTEEAKRLAARYGAKARVVSKKRLRDGFPMVHAVGRGSEREPRLIDLTWGAPGAPTLTLVGKGVCFDSGGLDLKSSGGMLRMKKDMGGAALVLGLALRIMDAGLPVRLRVLVPTVENMPGPGAFRPLDVLTSRSGKTVEVSNTDAEGRLILADALCLADEEAPGLIIDCATLTGSARMAVGPEITPFFTRDRALADAFAGSARRVRDPVWRLPLHGGYRRHLDSRVADLKNAASTSMAGSITAALFLREFVGRDTPWLHLDVFGWNDYARPGRPIGGEGNGLDALWAFVKARYGASES